MKYVFRVGFIILWFFILSYIWPRVTQAEIYSTGFYVVGIVAAPFWGGMGTYYGEKVEEFFKSKEP